MLATVGYLALGMRFRRSVGRTERGLFARFNHRKEDITGLRAPQQLGSPWVLPVLGLVGFLTRRPHLAVTATLALPLEKAMEHSVKKLLDRPRPARADGHSEQRDGAPKDGPSFPSGHAATAFTAATLCADYVSGPAKALGYAAASTTAMVRVRQGAHFPGDALGGALLGIAVASTLRALVGRPCTK
jgi:membrane-associated phospholipid phosphatase